MEYTFSNLPNCSKDKDETKHMLPGNAKMVSPANE